MLTSQVSTYCNSYNMWVYIQESEPVHTVLGSVPSRNEANGEEKKALLH